MNENTRPNILIVDDIDENLTFLKILFKQLNVNIIAAISGKESLVKTRDVDLALAIIDVMMPEMNGIQLATHLRNTPSKATVPIIFVTSVVSDDSEMVKHYESGAVDYICKPFNQKILLGKVRVFLDLYEQKQLILRQRNDLQNKTDELLNLISAQKLTENSLKITRDKLLFAQESAGAGIWDWDMTTGNMAWSSALFSLFGLDSEKITAEFDSWRKIIHPDDALLAEERIYSAVRDHQTLKSEYRIILPSGEIRWIDARGNTVYDENGNPLHMTGICLDITEQKKVQENLQKSERNFHTFFETIRDLIVVANLDGRIVYANSNLINKLGYTSEQLSNMYVLDLHPPVYRVEAGIIFDSMLRGERMECPLPLLTAAGNHLPVNTQAWFGTWNDVNCIIGLSKDLTAEHEAYQRFEHMFRKNPALMAISQLHDMAFMDVNDTFLQTLGYSAEEVISKNPSDLNLFPNQERQIELAAEMVRTGSISNVELMVRHKNGFHIPGLFSGEIISMQGTQYFFTVMIDISKRKQFEEALNITRLNLERSQKIANVGSWIYNIEENTLVWSDEMFRIFGIKDFDPEKNMIEPFLQAIYPEDTFSVRHLIEASLRDGESRHLEYRIVRTDGSVRWVRFLNEAHGDGESKMILQHGIMQDFTDFREKEEKVRESEKMYRTLLNASPEGIIITDITEKITEVSNIALEIFGAENKK